MNTTKIAGLALTLVITLAPSASAADIFSVKTALTTSAVQKSCGISMLSGEILEFSANGLEMRLGLPYGALSGITVTALPGPAQGKLLIDGERVEAFEFIDRAGVDRLRFVPDENTVAASVTFIPQAKDSAVTELLISILSEPDKLPEIRGGSYDTLRNVAVSGHITASDSMKGDMRIHVAKPPVNGAVRFDGLAFRYTPYKDVYGKDSFVVYADGGMNNYSNETIVTINIEKPKKDFYYADMSGDPSAYAAIKLRENAVMSGRQIGNSFFFFPGETVARGEFLMMLLSASGLERSVKPAANTGLPNDASIPAWLKPCVKKAVDEGIWPEKQPFIHDRPLTRAEAVVLTERASKISGAEDFTLQMYDAGSIPDWALSSYKNLAACKMLELYDNMARPDDTLTNSYAACLVWNLWKRRN